MSKIRHTIVPVAYAIFKKDDKYLLSRRFNTGFADGNYSFVCGHVEADEPAKTAALREAFEEVGIALKPENLRFVHALYMKSVDREDIRIFFECTQWEGDPSIMEPEKCDDLSWFSKNNVPETTLPYVIHVMNQIENKMPYSEFGW